ncbi:hypothetical protein BH23GEM10_BH23GEM10_03560 [soil metagenome]
MRARAVSCFAVVVTIVAGTTVQAQTADLRYHITSPIELRYMSADTGATDMQGLPTGGITTSTRMTATYSVSMSPLGDSVRVYVVTDTAAGTAEAMGRTQQLGAEMMGPPAEFTIGAVGLSEQLVAMDSEMDLQNAMAGMGKAAATNLVLLLPSREVRMGETWTDTLSQAGSMSGMEIESTSIIRGSWTGDTAVAGATYHVLSYTTDMGITGSGTVQGMDVTQTMKGERTETVLWDPARRIVVDRRHVSDMTTSMQMAGQFITITINGGGSLLLADGG